MLISHRHKFIFIKTKKTAGSSIETILMDKIGNDFIFGGMPFEGLDPININQECEHVGYKFISRKFPYEWKNYYKFCVERNPWDKVVSRYHWYNKERPNKARGSFEEFVLGKKKHFFKNDWPLYAALNPVVDKVIKYENLNNEFAEVCQLLNIPYNNELASVKLKSKYRNKTEYRHYYNIETRTAVHEAYRQTIDYFNYTF